MARSRSRRKSWRTCKKFSKTSPRRCLEYKYNKNKPTKPRKSRSKRKSRSRKSKSRRKSWRKCKKFSKTSPRRCVKYSYSRKRPTKSRRKSPVKHRVCRKYTDTDPRKCSEYEYMTPRDAEQYKRFLESEVKHAEYEGMTRDAMFLAAHKKWSSRKLLDKLPAGTENDVFTLLGVGDFGWVESSY